MRRISMAMLFAALIASGAGSPGAQPPSAHTGNIAFNTRSVGFIIGVEWGLGTMTLAGGRSYALRVRTLKIGMAGLEAVSAQGAIYNLDPRRPFDIAGTYAAMGAGITIGGGIGVQAMRNEKGVIIELKETQVGLAAKIAASGLEIEFVP